MERSDYWRVFATCWNKETRGWWPNGLTAIDGAFAIAPQVSYGGRVLPLETYLAVPTFLRRGCRLAL